MIGKAITGCRIRTPGDLELGKFKGDVLAALADLLESIFPSPGIYGSRRTQDLYLWDALRERV